MTLAVSRRKSLLALGATLLLGGAPIGAFAQSAEEKALSDFYRGKTLNILIGLSPGGAYDVYSRVIARFMGKHIPGDPTLVAKNMPGGGGRIVTRHVAEVAPKNGLTLATADRSLVLQQLVGDPTVQFDMRKLEWIGNPAADNGTVAMWAESGIRSIEDARRREVTMGATGKNATSQVVLALNELAGTKFKVVMGYPGGNDINLAMERGEVAGRASLPYSAWKATRADWLRDKRINIIAQIGLERDPELPDVPLIMELADNPDDKAVLKLLSAPMSIGLPLFTTPGTPPERVKALRRAFDATMKDPEFLEAARQGGLVLNPISGESLQTIVADILASPKPIANRLAKIIAE